MKIQFMKKYNRRDRRIYREGKAAGYTEGYRQGLEDGNPFNKIIKAAQSLRDGLAKAVNDPAFMAALAKAQELQEENRRQQDESRGELWGLDNDLNITDEITPEDPPTNETF